MIDLSDEVRKKIYKHLIGDGNYDRLTTGLKCNIEIEAISDITFQILIKDLDGGIIQNLGNFNVLEGDVVKISGLGYRVSYNEDEDIPPILDPKMFDPKSPMKPKAILKRKIDIDKVWR